MLTCEELTDELTRVGLAPLTRYAWSSQTSSTGESSYAPGSPRPTTARPCAGAIQRTHSHFFDASGRFGSLDWLGGQVDDGTYEVRRSTVEIGGVTFRYRVADDELYLTPELEPRLLRMALAHPKEFSDAGWAVSVAYAGHPWKRVPCQQWC